MSTSPNSPYGLPLSSRRATRPGLSPLDTSFRSTQNNYSDTTPSPNEKASAHSFTTTQPRRRDSLIFANATIPLSPPSSPSVYKENPFEGVAPRRRNPFARLFCCLGREERARRRAAWADEFEQVGEKRHWTEV